MRTLLMALLFVVTGHATPLLENDFVQVFRNSAPCAAGAPPCGDRVLVALGSIELSGQKMERGEIRGFKSGESYLPPQSGDYLEVDIKPTHPRSKVPGPGAPPAPDNKVLYQGKDFTVFEEKMEPGETSLLHSHNQRVAIFLNRTMVQQWTNGNSETRELVPDFVSFREAVVHTSKDVGSVPIHNILVEFKP